MDILIIIGLSAQYEEHQHKEPYRLTIPSTKCYLVLISRIVIFIGVDLEVPQLIYSLVTCYDSNIITQIVFLQKLLCQVL